MKLFLPYLVPILFSLGLAGMATAQQAAEETESYLLPGEEPENYDLEYLTVPFEDEFLDFLDAPHEFISEGVEVMAQEMDLFFADEKVYTETTSSYARLSTQADFDNTGASSFSGDLHLKVDLKKTKKKLKLLLESDTDRDLQTGTDTSKSPGQDKGTVNFYAALQKEISKKKEWRTKASLGIKLKVPLDPFLRIRAHKNFNFDIWNIRFTETLFWFNSKGSGASSLLEMDYPLTKNLFFRSRTSELWTDFLDYHELEQVFTLYHDITDRRAVSYNIGVYGITEPTTHAVRYYASIGYRQRIHREWLFIEVSPAVTFEKENDFKSERSLMLKLEMVFGNKYVYRTEED